MSRIKSINGILRIHILKIYVSHSSQINKHEHKTNQRKYLQVKKTYHC